MTITSYTYESDVAGPHVLLFGAVHGNETCGAVALDRLRREIEQGQLQLASGKLTVVPICNPEAHRQNVRQIDKNLNRIFTDMQKVEPACYESSLAVPLMALIRDCDVLLDLHSYGAGNIPLTLLDYDTPQTRKLMQAIGLPDVLVGWPELYADHTELSAGDAVQYAIEHGKNAICVECGQHTDPTSIEVAYNAARRVMAAEGLADAPAATVTDWRACRMKVIITREENGTWVKPWQHMDRVQKGELLATYADGRQVTASIDGYIVLPKPKALVGTEWIYLAVLEN